MTVRNFCPLPAGQRMAFWVFSCRTPPGCRWRKSITDREDRKGSHPALASSSDVQEAAKLPLSILLTPQWFFTLRCDQPSQAEILSLCLSLLAKVSQQSCYHTNCVTLLPRCSQWRSPCLQGAQGHSAEHLGQTALCTSIGCRHVDVGKFLPPTGCHTSLCPASPSLVAVTFHSKVFASLAQRQLVNWHLGQASTSSSGVSVRVVWTWAWLDVQAHIGLVLVTGTAPSSKYPGSWSVRLCFMAQIPASRAHEELRACLWVQAFVLTKAM